MTDLTDPDARVTENDVIEAFHVLARRALGLARSDSLIDAEYIESATPADLQVLGPALTLFFAALKTTSNPPVVQVPASQTHRAFNLSIETCPGSMLSLFSLWAKVVRPLQALSLDQQHDVARLICDLEPQSSPVSTTMIALASDIEKLAISISQRRTFLERYSQDLERGLAAQPHTTFNAPPEYIPDQGPSNSNTSIPPSRPSSETVSSIPPTDEPAMVAVRETLYAALAEVIATSPSLARILSHDPPRGYFAAVALAIVEAANNNVSSDGQRLRIFSFSQGGSQVVEIGTQQAPMMLRVFVREILRFSAVLRNLQERDDQKAIDQAMAGQDDLASLTLVETLKQELELGPEASNSAESSHLIEIRSVCNAINRMAIAVTALPGFQQRTGVFEILRGLSG